MFDQPPPGWIIRVAFGQCPNHVNMIRHDHICINDKWTVIHHNGKCPPEIIYILDQDRAPVKRYNRKKNMSHLLHVDGDNAYTII